MSVSGRTFGRCRSAQTLSAGFKLPASAATASETCEGQDGGRRPATRRKQGRTGSGKADAPTGSSALSKQRYGCPLVQTMTVDPVLFAFGTFADLHHSMQLFPAEEEATHSDWELQQAKTVLKVHRTPTADSEMSPCEGRYPTPRLCSDKQEAEDIRSWCRAGVQGYKALQALQGREFPKLIFNAPATLIHRSHAPKLLLERVGGSLYEQVKWWPQLVCLPGERHH